MQKQNKIRFGKLQYREPISEEWINGRVRNHAAHTFIVSHPILWFDWLIMQYLSKVQKDWARLDTISGSYLVGWIKSMRNILD